MRRALPGALAAAALALAAAAPAGAAILAGPDANDLAQSLADATEVQGVCYGWRIGVRDPTGTEDGPEIGSSAGPGEDVVPGQGDCGRYVVLAGDVIYTSEYEEAEDSAAWSIDSNLAKPPTVAELDDLGYTANDLLGDENDSTLINAVGALPQLVADHGEAKPVPFETAATPPGVSGEPTNSPGSDFLRQNGALLALCGVLAATGLFLLLRDLSRRRRPTPTPT